MCNRFWKGKEGRQNRKGIHYSQPLIKSQPIRKPGFRPPLQPVAIDPYLQHQQQQQHQYVPHADPSRPPVAGRSSYHSGQEQRGPAPFASFEDLSLASFEMSPGDEQIPLPGNAKIGRPIKERSQYYAIEVRTTYIDCTRTVPTSL